MATSPSHIFAIKALAARTNDIDDLRLLAGIVGVESADAALKICANFTQTNPYPQIRRRAPRNIRLTTPLRASARPDTPPGWTGGADGLTA
jgi:hypothetical protein